MDRRERLAAVFADTQVFYRENETLAAAVRLGIRNTKFYPADAYPPIVRMTTEAGRITVSRRKTFEAAIHLQAEYPNKKVTVLNFASATNPGGGVKNGSSAQEESLCRCSTLYPALSQQRLWDCYYLPNRASGDALHTDACIYTPFVTVCKTDEDYPKRLPEEDFVAVDVITCAAPNLRSQPANIHNPGDGNTVHISPEELYELHLSRAKHILHVSAANGTEVLVLGAFGCGAFRNDPAVVAKAYADALAEYAQYFERIDFAIYCRDWETENYDVFKRVLGK